MRSSSFLAHLLEAAPVGRVGRTASRALAQLAGRVEHGRTCGVAPRRQAGPATAARPAQGSFRGGSRRRGVVDDQDVGLGVPRIQGVEPGVVQRTVILQRQPGVPGPRGELVGAVVVGRGAVAGPEAFGLAVLRGR